MTAAFGQLYYTSCERGLAGYPGFQFNAATPGLRQEVMTDVEALAGYEPPRALAMDADRTRLDRYPVNLCFRPGSSAVIANVVFVGNDYSHRFGNYFAHALVTEDLTGSLGELLPIELWRAPFWTSVIVSDTTLPTLPAPPRRGLIDRAVVEAFVGSHRCMSRLPALLTAADRAVSLGERKVVIVDEDADAVAKWIAAICYLLPANLARRMSFATYQHRPGYSRLDVVGTVPESDVDRSAFDSHLLFDMVADRASPIDAHPLAELLADIGVLDAPEAWTRAAALAAGGEQSLDDWHPALAAAVMRAKLGGAANAAAVAPWLATHARRLGPHAVADIGERVLPAAALGGGAAESLRALAGAAGAVGVSDLSDAVELAWVDTVLRDVVRGALRFADVEVALRTDEARGRVRFSLARGLSSMDVDSAMDVLEWTARSGIVLDEETLRPTGNRVFGPQVLERRTDSRMRTLLAALPELRWGAVDYLAEAARADFDAVVAALGSGVADLLEAKEEHQLAVAVLLAEVRDGRRSSADALREIAQDGVDDAVMTQLWPSGGWSHAEAIEVLNALEPDDRSLPIVLKWLSASLLSPPVPAEERMLDKLCDRVLSLELQQVLSPAARERIDLHSRVTLVIDQMTRATHRDFDILLDKVCRSYGPSGEQRREMIVTSLLDRFAELDDYLVAMVLVRLRDVRADYLAGLTESRRPSLNAVMRHLHIAWLVQTEIRLRYRGWQQASDDIVRVASVLRDRLGRKELKAVVAGLERRYGDITTWSGDLSERPGVLSRVLGPLVPRRWR